MGSWRPPPFGGTQIVSIFRVTQASKGGAVYLDRPDSAGGWGSWDGGGWVLLHDTYPLSWGATLNFQPSLTFLGPVSPSLHPCLHDLLSIRYS